MMRSAASSAAAQAEHLARKAQAWALHWLALWHAAQKGHMQVENPPGHMTCAAAQKCFALAVQHAPQAAGRKQ